MRICLLTPTFLPRVGGTEYVTDQLARWLLALGHEPIVLATGEPCDLDVPYPVRWQRRPHVARWLRERTSEGLHKLHRELPLDVVCCNYAYPAGYGAVRLGRRLGLPVVIVSHGGDLYLSTKNRRRPLIWSRTQYTYRHADALVAISPYIDRLIRQINPNPRRLELIPNGIDLAEYQQPAERPGDFADPRPFCLCLGNLGPMKGFHDAIEAYAAARGELGDMAMVIVGDGALRGELEALASRRGVLGDVIFCGRRIGAAKRWFLRNCRFGLMPSIEEGHPIVGLEFLACGKPLICSLNEAFDGMYEEGENAFRVPSRDPHALSRAMVRMARANLEAMGRASQQRATHYDWPIIARRYVALFEQLVEPSKVTRLV